MCARSRAPSNSFNVPTRPPGAAGNTWSRQRRAWNLLGLSCPRSHSWKVLQEGQDLQRERIRFFSPDFSPFSELHRGWNLHLFCSVTRSRTKMKQCSIRSLVNGGQRDSSVGRALAMCMSKLDLVSRSPSGMIPERKATDNYQMWPPEANKNPNKANI